MCAQKKVGNSNAKSAGFTLLVIKGLCTLDGYDDNYTLERVTRQL